MDVRDWITILATLLGPILAVQAQKAVENYRERGRRKMFVFSQLMATRRARASGDHVTALNMIDVVFHGGKRRSTNERDVLNAWKEYHDNLNTPFDQQGFQAWSSRGDDLFANLLAAIDRKSVV